MNADYDIIVSEACDWIARLHGGEPSADDRRVLEAWMAQSDLHRDTIQRLAREWEAMNVLTELAVPHPAAVGAAGTVERQRRSSAWSRGWWAGWAAGVCTLLAAFVWFAGTVDPANEKLHQTYVTQRGVQERVALPDGSMAVLNSGSSLAVDFSADARRVRLIQGEAHFEVAKDPDRPFTVRAGKSLFSAVGTAFAIRVNDHAVEITVVEGRVSLAASPLPDGELLPGKGSVGIQELLGVGDRLVVSDNGAAVIERETVSAEEMTRKLAWRDGKVLFQGETMAEVVAELSRHTDIRIVMNGDGLESLRVGGAFDIGQTQKFLNTLQASFGLDIRYAGDTVYISAASES